MNKVLASIVEIAIRESLTNYETKEDGNSLEGLHLYHENEDNSLVIYDDTNHVLNKVQLPNERSFNLTHTLRQLLHQPGKSRLFEKEYIARPFSVRLVDKDFMVLEELFVLDDDTIKVSNIVWKNIEKELDDFIEKLLLQ